MICCYVITATIMSLVWWSLYPYNIIILILRIAPIYAGTDRGTVTLAAARLPWNHDGYNIIMCMRTIIILRAGYDDGDDDDDDNNNDNMCDNIVYHPRFNNIRLHADDIL